MSDNVKMAAGLRAGCAMLHRAYEAQAGARGNSGFPRLGLGFQLFPFYSIFGFSEFHLQGT